MQHTPIPFHPPLSFFLLSMFSSILTFSFSIFFNLTPFSTFIPVPVTVAAAFFSIPTVRFNFIRHFSLISTTAAHLLSSLPLLQYTPFHNSAPFVISVYKPSQQPLPPLILTLVCPFTFPPSTSYKYVRQTSCLLFYLSKL